MNLEKKFSVNEVKEISLSKTNIFLKQVYTLLSLSLFVACLGVYLGMGFSDKLQGVNFWGLVILELVLIVAISIYRNKQGLNLLLLFTFTFISGLTLVPLLVNILSLNNGGVIIGQSMLLTSIAFISISMFALTTKKDYSFMGKFLFISLIIIIFAAISNIFIQSPMFQLMIASVSSILFSLYILVDTQNIIKGNYDSPVSATLSLYLDILNLFISLLQILGILKSND